MIVPNKPKWFATLFFWTGTTFRRTWPRIGAVTLVAGLVTYAHEAHGMFEQNMTATPFALVGFALSIFLGFRNSTSYDRFWEGRKLWGALVNHARSTSRRIVTLIQPAADDPDSDEHRDLVYGVIGYVHALRLHLRGEDSLDELEPFFEPDLVATLHTEKNRPIAILTSLGRRFSTTWREGRVDTMHLPMLEESLEHLTDVQGGCERIKATPIPFSYTVLIHRIVAAYCLGPTVRPRRRHPRTHAGGRRVCGLRVLRPRRARRRDRRAVRNRPVRPPAECDVAHDRGELASGAGGDGGVAGVVEAAR